LIFQIKHFLEHQILQKNNSNKRTKTGQEPTHKKDPGATKGKPEVATFLQRARSLRRMIPLAMGKDRASFFRRVNALLRMKADQRRQPKSLARLSSLENRIKRSVAERERRLKSRPDISFTENLPITARKDEIVSAIQKHPVVIIAGDTGSGKSTQIPKMCLAAGRGIDGKIACTQPRRIAATTIAGRIAEELGEKIGNSVGYKIRFKDRTPKDAYIKVLTDGMLLAETQQDPRLTEYDIIMVDEAHERSLNIDFILGILKNLIRKRKDLKLIITSATIDTEKFSKGFGDAPVIQVSGRRYPVSVKYRPLDPELEEQGETTYVDAAVLAAQEICRSGPFGDILVFMPTEQDILETCERLEGRALKNITVLPLFARLPGAQQSKVFTPAKGRKIVVSTNVAETSLTIPGIKYVVDTGLARILTLFTPNTDHQPSHQPHFQEQRGSA
jgi:ATP-dependent helicase HrpA